MTWFELHNLPEAHPFLLGLLELDPLGGVGLELHVERVDEGPTVSAWLDEWGWRWGAVEAGQA